MAHPLLTHFVAHRSRQRSLVSSLTELLNAAASPCGLSTSHPSLFAFSKILALPSCLGLALGTFACLKEPHILFSSMYYGCLPMAPGVTTNVLPYDNLMVELDVTNVRQLEDFLNNECMYDGIVRGKLDQLKRCFEVPFAAGRDPRPGELGDMLHALSNL
ncbi:COP9 signalosome complex subunit 7 isoform X1 [Brassica rapa]|uniref:COP9 signalosome complex subunit 7 isoform X1 n=1 Tax=Brassica campestris TaxID=3711 RepID=UPI0004F1CA4D|nr:COP9 signalosome complex subunit 7 isoform X1 [Brassica rapa]